MILEGDYESIEHYLDLTTIMGISSSGLLDTRLGRDLMSWIIDTCTDWDLGTYAGTKCESGDLILNRY